MASPWVNSCCCGCTLRTGSLIIFWTLMITSLLFTLSAAMYVNIGSNSQSDIAGTGQQSRSQNSQYRYSDYLFNSHKDNLKYGSAKQTDEPSPAGCVILGGTQFFLFIACIIGIFAVYVNIPILVFPFLVTDLLAIIGFFIFPILQGVIVGLIPSIIVSASYAYCFVVVYSYYAETSESAAGRYAAAGSPYGPIPDRFQKLESQVIESSTELVASSEKNPNQKHSSSNEAEFTPQADVTSEKIIAGQNETQPKD